MAVRSVLVHVRFKAISRYFLLNVTVAGGGLARHSVISIFLHEQCHEQCTAHDYMGDSSSYPVCGVRHLADRHLFMQSLSNIQEAYYYWHNRSLFTFCCRTYTYYIIISWRPRFVCPLLSNGREYQGLLDCNPMHYYFLQWLRH